MIDAHRAQFPAQVEPSDARLVDAFRPGWARLCIHEDLAGLVTERFPVDLARSRTKAQGLYRAGVDVEPTKVVALFIEAPSMSAVRPLAVWTPLSGLIADMHAGGRWHMSCSYRLVRRNRGLAVYRESLVSTLRFVERGICAVQCYSFPKRKGSLMAHCVAERDGVYRIDGRVGFFGTRPQVLPDAVMPLPGFPAPTSSFGWIRDSSITPSSGDIYLVEFIAENKFRIWGYVDCYGRAFVTDRPLFAPRRAIPDTSCSRDRGMGSPPRISARLSCRTRNSSAIRRFAAPFSCATSAGSSSCLLL